MESWPGVSDLDDKRIFCRTSADANNALFRIVSGLDGRTKMREMSGWLKASYTAVRVTS